MWFNFGKSIRLNICPLTISMGRASIVELNINDLSCHLHTVLEWKTDFLNKGLCNFLLTKVFSLLFLSYRLQIMEHIYCRYGCSTWLRLPLFMVISQKDKAKSYHSVKPSSCEILPKLPNNLAWRTKKQTKLIWHLWYQ